VARVSNLLESKGTGVATVAPDATVAAVVAELARLRIGALVVSADGAHIDGIVSERDVVQRLHQLRGDLLDEPVSSIMSRAVETCAPTDDLDSLMRTMTERRVRHLPVVADGVLCGIVSIGDVVKQRIGELERDRHELLEYITAR
jgi:CBS domain-containing protein